MPWVTITADDVKGALTAAEVKAIGTVSVDVGQSDPVTARIGWTQNLIRGFIRGKYPVAASGIPDGLMDPALSIIIYKGLGRVSVELQAKRKDEYEAAMKILDDVRSGKFVPETPTVPETSSVPTSTPSINGGASDRLCNTPRRFSRAKQDGI
jgi:hypothetical protein